MRIVGATENDRPSTAGITGHADIEGCFLYAMQFQAVIDRALLLRKHRGGLAIGPLKSLANSAFARCIANKNEVPGLHEANGWRRVSSLQQAHYKVIRQGIADKLVPDIAPCMYGAINRGAFGFGK
ncbi:hypothetical protein IP76_13275 [Rhizobium sp. AAP43]|nr:hypothetical protein IP76_13275 [Rhizobium sp. AAP43]